MRIHFVGAAGSVTGSCHWVEAAGHNILVDCGMFQGSRSLEEENAADFGFDPAAIDTVLLTHAHLDHCGRIPLLVKRGFRGRILTTPATADLARLVLLDAAGLQEEEQRHHGDRRATPQQEPLYTRQDVLNALDQFQGLACYGDAMDLFPGVRATFHPAGHILGSAWILLELEENGVRRRLAFSGDLGHPGEPILAPPDPLPAVDDLIMESTYGDRNHRSLPESVQELQQTVSAALGRNGNIVIPTFALERAQVLLLYLGQMVEQGKLPAIMPVYLDSPMAISATEVFRRHPECIRPEAAPLFAPGKDPFALPGLRFTRDRQDSMAINKVQGAIIMAGSGMASGGRIVHHLRRTLPDQRNSVIFVGYAGAGTLARRIIDGAHEVRIFGETVPVRAQVHTIGGFSAHAGHDDLIRWAAGGPPTRAFLVHGEADAAAVLARDLNARGIAASAPAQGQSVDLAASAAISS